MKWMLQTGQYLSREGKSIVMLMSEARSISSHMICNALIIKTMLDLISRFHEVARVAFCTANGGACYGSRVICDNERFCKCRWHATENRAVITVGTLANREWSLENYCSGRERPALIVQRFRLRHKFHFSNKRFVDLKRRGKTFDTPRLKVVRWKSD